MSHLPSMSLSVRGPRFLLCVSLFGSVLSNADAAYSDLIAYFESIADETLFPVDGLDLDAVESAFGPRYQSSTGNYDWHRGIDIDSNGAGSGELAIVAPIDGVFYDYRTTSSGGNIVILQHDLPATYTYAGQNITRFYTWYLHLDDDNITPVDDSWVEGVTAVSAGDTLGYMGDTGAPAGGGGSYAVHLHWELRIGTNSSLEYQLNNDTTQWGFDPHWNPMLLYPEDGAAYTQKLTYSGALTLGSDKTLGYTINNDEMPVLNRFEIELIETGTDNVAKSHTLDYNQRTGFDPSSTALLDTQETDAPYIEPQSFGDTAVAFATQLVIPGSWSLGYDPDLYHLEINAFDLWDNSVSATAVPEPRTVALSTGLGALLLASIRRRKGKISC